MSNLFWLNDVQIAHQLRCCPSFHSKPRVDEERLLINIISINRDGLRRRDTTKVYGLPKTLYNRRMQ